MDKILAKAEQTHLLAEAELVRLLTDPAQRVRCMRRPTGCGTNMWAIK
jgi:hypothetical protein